MDMLDRLRELDAAASPGPLRVVTGYPQKDVPLHSVLGDGDATVVVSGYDIRSVQLAALSHLLLPAIELLELMAEPRAGGDDSVSDDCLWDISVEYGDVRKATAILAKLEEAVG